MYKKNPKIIEKKTEQGMLIFNADTGHMVELNITAALLWEKTGESFDSEELKKILLDNCSNIGDIEKDIPYFIEKAIENGMVEKDG